MSSISVLATHILNFGKIRRPTTDGGQALTDDNVRPGPPSPASPDPTIPGAVPSLCVFLSPTGGSPSRGRRDPEADGVQITVRSEPYAFDAGLGLADAVYEAVHLRPPPGYFDAKATQRPSHLNQDDQGQHLFVFNLRLWRDVVESD